MKTLPEHLGGVALLLRIPKGWDLWCQCLCKAWCFLFGHHWDINRGSQDPFWCVWCDEIRK